jgi:uncharacterized membrane protein YphA (DoxX/SURF4 family)
MVSGWGWGLAARATIVYALPSLLNYLRLEYLHFRPRQLWEAAFPPFMVVVHALKPSASGDLPWQMLYDLLVALIVGGVWLAIDRKRKHEPAIFEASRVIARYALAGMLFYYGGEKFVGDQGGWSLEPPFLVHQAGEINGFTAMMSWLSYSSIYAWFAGWAEAGAGLLMFFRRFTLLAALLTLADMGMVWLINQSYWDHWGAAAFSPLFFSPMAVFLVAPYGARLINFFLLNRQATTRFTYLAPRQWFQRAAFALKIVAVPWIIYCEVISSVNVGVEVHTHSPLWGVYNVESFERNGVLEPLAAEYPDRWREVAFSALAGSSVLGDLYARTEGDELVSMGVSWPELGPDEKENFTTSARARNAERRAKMTAGPQGELPIHSLTHLRRGESILKMPHKTGEVGSFHYAWSNARELTLEGTVDGQKLKMVLRREDLDSMPYFRYRWKPI